MYIYKTNIDIKRREKGTQKWTCPKYSFLTLFVELLILSLSDWNSQYDFIQEGVKSRH